MSPIVNESQDASADALRGADCGTSTAATAGGYQDRCGHGPRQPLLGGLAVYEEQLRRPLDH